MKCFECGNPDATAKAAIKDNFGACDFYCSSCFDALLADGWEEVKAPPTHRDEGVDRLMKAAMALGEPGDLFKDADTVILFGSPKNTDQWQ